MRPPRLERGTCRFEDGSRRIGEVAETQRHSLISHASQRFAQLECFCRFRPISTVFIPQLPLELPPEKKPVASRSAVQSAYSAAGRAAHFAAIARWCITAAVRRGYWTLTS